MMFKVDDLKLRRRSWMKIAAIPYNRLGWEFSDCNDVTSEDVAIIKRWVKTVS